MAAIARLTQTITIVDKSNKVVGTGKQLKEVFYEAKHAYLERRAEIKAERKKKEERELQKAIHAMSIADEEERGSDASRSKPRKQSRTQDPTRRRRNSDEHSRYSHAEQNRDARYSHNSRHHSGSATPESPRNSSGQIARSGTVQSRSAPVSPVDDTQSRQLIRRSRTDIAPVSRPKLARSRSTPDVDLDLAYGEFHDGDLKALSRKPPQEVALDVQQKELGSLVSKCQTLLDEANCAQHSVRKMVAHLQSNPDAMAAVALTLAEISDVASKMAPGALAMFKTSAPAVMALLASPQFLIAVGVGIGVTVVMFGGYKIVKKIKAHRAAASDSQDALAYGPGGVDEALDVHELDRIENWRRGIADARADDDGQTVASGYSYTSVEGEIITPYAARSMGHLPIKKSKDKKAKKEKEKKEKERKEKEKKEKKKKASKKQSDKDDDLEDGEDGNTVDGSTLKSSTDRDRQLIKVKKPSPLRRMFVNGASVKSS